MRICRHPADGCFALSCPGCVCPKGGAAASACGITPGGQRVGVRWAALWAAFPSWLLGTCPSQGRSCPVGTLGVAAASFALFRSGLDLPLSPLPSTAAVRADGPWRFLLLPGAP